MSIRIWLDDIRNPKTHGWIICRTASSAIEMIKSGGVEFIDFDHDLGDDEDGTGYDVAKWVEAECFFGMKCPKWNIHSANPVGEKNITMAMKSAERMSKK